MSIYKTQVVNSRDWTDVTEKTIQFVRRDKKPITDLQQIKQLVDGLQKAADKKHDRIRILVRAMTPDGMKTLKGYNAQLALEEFDEYYQNSVQDAQKFRSFSHLQITVEKEK